MARILRSGCGMEHIPTLLIRLSTMDSTGATVAEMVGLIRLKIDFLENSSELFGHLLSIISLYFGWQNFGRIFTSSIE